MVSFLGFAGANEMREEIRLARIYFVKNGLFQMS